MPLSFVDLIWPRRCAVCDEPLTGDAVGACPTCAAALPLVTGPRCFTCGCPVHGTERLSCGPCQKHPHDYDRGRAVFIYNRQIRKALVRFKYGGRMEYAGYFAAWMASRLPRPNILPDLLVPVPGHPNRALHYGYNQSLLLADALSRQINVPVADLLLRRRSSLPQKTLNRVQRMRNMENAFSIRPVDLNGAYVLLVDDIYTTGSTVDVCAKQLKSCGAHLVDFMTVAIGIDD